MNKATIFDRIKQDHDYHRELVAKIMDTSGDTKERRQAFDTLYAELVSHANAEEQTLYAVLLRDADVQEKARHSVHEHEQIDDVLSELDEMEMSNPGWLNKFKKLKEALEHHMKEEEGEVFTKARKSLSQEQAIKMVADFNNRKSDEKKAA